MQKETLRHLLFTICLLGLLSIPLFTPLPSLAQFWDMESRYLEGVPVLSIYKALLKFPQSFQDYFKDHYLLHNQQVEVLQTLRLEVFSEKNFPNVLIGEENWLYYTGEGNISDYQCVSLFTPSELDAIANRLADIHAQLSSRNIQFLLVIAPNKESIYPEYLPAEVRQIGSTCRIDQVLTVLREQMDIQVLDLRAPLLEAKSSHQVYHRTDTHWNDFGAHLASLQILSLVQEHFPAITTHPLEDYQQETQEFQGDLAQFLPFDTRFLEQKTVLSPLIPTPTTITAGEGRTINANTPDSGLPRAIIFRDSFTDALIPFLAPQFEGVTFIHSFAVDLELVDEQQPDIVIYELAQRYLYMLLEDWES